MLLILSAKRALHLARGNAMNARRGFFRLWVVSSALWVIGVAIVAFQVPPTLQPLAFVMPDATSGFFKLNNIFDQFDPDFKAAHRQVEFPNDVTLFVHNSVPEATIKGLAPEFFKTYSSPRADDLTKARLRFWGFALSAAVLPSLSLLLLGSLVGWIFSGFAGDANSRGMESRGN
jgi:hypothetical protein